MMGGKSSKNKKNVEFGSPSTPVQIKINSEYSEHLSSYERACSEDPKLESFDAALHERTNRVINKLASGVEIKSLSFDSLREVTQCLLDMNQDVVKVILQDKEDIWNNQDLFSLVNLYFESTAKTMDFCSELENCLNRARRSQVIIQFAVKQFEEEAEIPVNGDKENRKYEKTLKELKRFKVAGEPFTKEFFALFDLVYKQQVMMLEELHKLKKKLDKKLKNIKTWRRVSNMVFVTAFVSVLIFSVVAAAVAAPPVVAAIAGALAVPVGSVGKWCNTLWTKYEKVVRGQKEIITSIRIGTYISVKEMDNISILVRKVEVEIESLLKKAEFAITEEKEVRLAIDEIKKKLDVFTETIEELGEHAGKYCSDVTKARTVILQRIIRYPASSPKDEAPWTEMV
ncbi:unnamed protein product [Arabidopsis lyrata]|uniref:Uncharacterized protein n=1 Tax=Arabidopsis lyrata subsp. lyrata TaxID=81972 RepID=D7L093_ARALL|nr:UPF0496 protein At2g18630 [Arabidopsis lyrata subsp. lyrata]EFH60405.1 hypothetical protein ARALYDRAFT_319811 [Arabidopsis lyrata subsp. lyrata]CAH8262466.1 unnamed protein product [Arabidopsis lyrata]|eukprot:XP_002884146.1 UPF0496 protein At2g18630 [Arabidopsis lyrata subsp. lyrata]